MIVGKHVHNALLPFVSPNVDQMFSTMVHVRITWASFERSDDWPTREI